jgi:hypothetical protein
LLKAVMYTLCHAVGMLHGCRALWRDNSMMRSRDPHSSAACCAPTRQLRGSLRCRTAKTPRACGDCRCPPTTGCKTREGGHVRHAPAGSGFTRRFGSERPPAAALSGRHVVCTRPGTRKRTHGGGMTRCIWPPKSPPWLQPREVVARAARRGDHTETISERPTNSSARNGGRHLPRNQYYGVSCPPRAADGRQVAATSAEHDLHAQHASLRVWW